MWARYKDVVVQWLWQPDKLQHIILSVVMVQAFTVALPLAGAALLAFLVGLLKELWDARYGSGFSWGDILANVLGIALGALLVLPFLGTCGTGF